MLGSSHKTDASDSKVGWIVVAEIRSGIQQSSVLNHVASLEEMCFVLVVCCNLVVCRDEVTVGM